MTTSYTTLSTFNITVDGKHYGVRLPLEDILDAMTNGGAASAPGRAMWRLTQSLVSQGVDFESMHYEGTS